VNSGVLQILLQGFLAAERPIAGFTLEGWGVSYGDELNYAARAGATAGSHACVSLSIYAHEIRIKGAHVRIYVCVCVHVSVHVRVYCITIDGD